MGGWEVTVLNEVRERGGRIRDDRQYLPLFRRPAVSFPEGMIGRWFSLTHEARRAEGMRTYSSSG